MNAEFTIENMRTFLIRNLTNSYPPWLSTVTHG